MNMTRSSAQVNQIAHACPMGAISPNTPVQALYRRWVSNRMMSDASSVPDAAREAASNAMLAIEAEVADTPCLTAADFAAKMIIITNMDEFDIAGPNRDAFWAEAFDLVGRAA